MASDEESWKALTTRTKTPCGKIIVIFNYKNKSEKLADGDEVYPIYQTHCFLDTSSERKKLEETVEKLLNDDKVTKEDICDILKNELSQNYLCRASFLESISRLVSEILRNKNCPECGHQIHTTHNTIQELKHIRCHKPQPLSKRKTTSCSDAIANAIYRERYVYKDEEKELKRKEENGGEEEI